MDSPYNILKMSYLAMGKQKCMNIPSIYELPFLLLCMPLDPKNKPGGTLRNSENAQGKDGIKNLLEGEGVAFFLVQPRDRIHHFYYQIMATLAQKCSQPTGLDSGMARYS